jgi:hypothetical protein
MNHTYEGEGLFGAVESATGLSDLSKEPEDDDSEDLNENSNDAEINLETVVDDENDDTAAEEEEAENEEEAEEEEAENYLTEDGLISDISSEAEGVTDLSSDSIDCDEFFLSIFWKFKSSTYHQGDNIIWSGFVQGNRRDMIRSGYDLHEGEERKPVIDITLFLEAVNDDIFASFDRFIESRADEDPLHIAGGISLREKYEHLLRGAVFVVVGMNTRDGPSLVSFFASHIRSSMRDFFKSRSLAPLLCEESGNLHFGYGSTPLSEDSSSIIVKEHNLVYSLDRRDPGATQPRFDRLAIIQEWPDENDIQEILESM